MKQYIKTFSDYKKIYFIHKDHKDFLFEGIKVITRLLALLQV